MPRVLPPVDDEVFEALQQLAEPLVDDINSVLRRLLGLNGSSPPRVQQPMLAPAPTNGASPARSARTNGRAKSKATKRTSTKRGRTAKTKTPRQRAPRGSLLPEVEYEMPMLRYLADHGGRAPASEVIDAIGQELSNRLTPIDHEFLRSGEVRWKNRTQFVRLKLIQEGAMTKDSPRGVWEITEVGRSRVVGAMQ